MLTTWDATVRIDGRPDAPGSLRIERDRLWSWELTVQLNGLEPGEREWVTMDAGDHTYVGQGLVVRVEYDEAGAATSHLRGVGPLAQMDRIP